jgi:hypothetical protein
MRRVQNSPAYRRVLSDTPSFAAITLVAPGERFKALAILVTPCLSFAIVFNVRTSSFNHARRTSFFFFAISARSILEPGLYHRTFSNARCSSVI